MYTVRFATCRYNGFIYLIFYSFQSMWFYCECTPVYTHIYLGLQPLIANVTLARTPLLLITVSHRFCTHQLCGTLLDILVQTCTKCKKLSK